MLHSQIKGPKETREKQSDLIWFDYETRLRTLVEELLEPTLRRSREERELFEILSKKNDQLGKRLDDVEFMFQKTQKRQTAFEDIFKRIHDLDVSRKAEDKGLSDRIDNIKKNMEELNTDMFLLRERMTEVERRGEKLSGEFVTTTDHLAEYRTKLSKVVDDLDQTWKTQVEDQQNSNKEIFSKLQHTNEKLTELADSIKNNGHQLETAHKNIEQLNSKTLTLDSKIAKSTEQLEGYSHQASFLATFKPRLDSLEKQICTNEKYIEQYLPLYLQIQIAETVQGSLHPNDIKRHASHEQKLFQELVESLKTAEAPNLSKKIEYVHEALDPVVKKYSQEAARGKKNDGGITRSADFQLGVEEEHHEEAVDYRLIAELNRKISQIQTENERSLKECKDEFSRRFLMVTRDQVQVSENFNVQLEGLRSNMESLIEARVADAKEGQAKEDEELLKQQQQQQINDIKETEKPSTRGSVMGEKEQAFLRRLSEVFAVSVDTINGMLATLLREERDRELATMEEQERPLAYSQMLRDVANKKSSTPTPKPEKMKRSVEMLSAQGTREDFTSESPIIPKEGDIKGQQMNPETITKLQLLMLLFENFKPCLSFAMKYRIATDFMQFFESEAEKFIQLEAKMKKEPSQILTKERSITPQIKSRIVSRTNSMSNKSSLVDITAGGSYEKKPAGVSSITKV